MIKIFLVIIISFYLESNISLFIDYSTNFFNILFVLSSLVIISKLVKDNMKFYLLSSIIGLIYDILFTSKLGFNLLIFLLIAIFIKNSDKFIKSKIIQYLSVIIIYRLISYSILLLTGYLHFNLFILFKSIYSSLILNYVYVMLLYFIFCRQK